MIDPRFLNAAMWPAVNGSAPLPGLPAPQPVPADAGVPPVTGGGLGPGMLHRGHGDARLTDGLTMGDGTFGGGTTGDGAFGGGLDPSRGGTVAPMQLAEALVDVGSTDVPLQAGPNARRPGRRPEVPDTTMRAPAESYQPGQPHFVIPHVPPDAPGLERFGFPANQHWLLPTQAAPAESREDIAAAAPSPGNGTPPPAANYRPGRPHAYVLYPPFDAPDLERFSLKANLEHLLPPQPPTQPAVDESQSADGGGSQAPAFLDPANNPYRRADGEPHYIKRVIEAYEAAAGPEERRYVLDGVIASLPEERDAWLAFVQNMRIEAFDDPNATPAPDMEQQAFDEWRAANPDLAPVPPGVQGVFYYATPDGRLFRKNDLRLLDREALGITGLLRDLENREYAHRTRRAIEEKDYWTLYLHGLEVGGMGGLGGFGRAPTIGPGGMWTKRSFAPKHPPPRSRDDRRKAPAKLDPDQAFEHPELSPPDHQSIPADQMPGAVPGTAVDGQHAPPEPLFVPIWPSDDRTSAPAAEPPGESRRGAVGRTRRGRRDGAAPRSAVPPAAEDGETTARRFEAAKRALRKQTDVRLKRRVITDLSREAAARRDVPVGDAVAEVLARYVGDRADAGKRGNAAVGPIGTTVDPATASRATEIRDRVRAGALPWADGVRALQAMGFA